MINQTRKILCFLLLIATLLSADAATSTKEKILADRAKRVVHLEHSMAQVQKQLDDHRSRKKRYPANRVKSLESRLASYKSQIYDYSRDLTDEELEELVVNHPEL